MRGEGVSDSESNASEFVRQGRELRQNPLARPDLEDPLVALSLLESDQIVAAKGQTRFGKRELTRAMKWLLWALRVYAVLMFVLVLISVIRAMRP
jgi:hypothetical protein